MSDRVAFARLDQQNEVAELRREVAVLRIHHREALQELQVVTDERDTALTENERLRFVQFAPPLGDNHHNAAVCPYCSPGGADLAAQLRAGERERDALSAVIDKVEAAATEELDAPIRSRSGLPVDPVQAWREGWAEGYTIACRKFAVLAAGLAAPVGETPDERCGEVIAGLYGAATYCQRPPHTDEHTANDGLGRAPTGPIRYLGGPLAVPALPVE